MPKLRSLPFWLAVRVFFRRIYYQLQSPLALRGSIYSLRRFHKHPYLALLRLFIPWPSWRFPLPEQISVKEMLGNETLMFERRRHFNLYTSIPIWCMRDTPIRSLYRLYESMASGEYAPMGRETEYFWYRGWELHAIEDPRDPDPVRYAIVASLVEELVTAFNWRLSLGMRRNHQHIIRESNSDPYPPYTPVAGPKWAKSVPAITPESLDGLPQEFVDENQLVLEAKGCSKTFLKRNIVTNVGWLYTI
ncbi:hypothetical protein MGYG_01635 [Nannizzia gypsea CBS 118893]|uniref:Uncharacterized protein n=1 Tax=Arthroderma gypseum (strain ATCC MYA-4604 / CBS 118893) TaxID=535722 RepID=E5R247_ARTGP|nr:hypothetical protein MGYG_01635 [Nannizzia gypsea CBS 118893]EFQ98611.1 hypothetical protein MGYG_01635 [Nannizzia gypsea CBS 118893]